MAVAIGGGNQEEESETVHGPTVQWTASNIKEVRRDAIRRAVKDAMADAEAAVGSNKLTVTQIEVSGQDRSVDGPNYSRWMAGDSEPPPTSTVRVHVEVRVTCTY